MNSIALRETLVSPINYQGMNMTRTATAPAAKIKGSARATPRQAQHAEVTRDDSVFAEAMQRYTDAQDYLLKFFKAPTWKRTLCAFVTTIAIGVGIGMFAGSILNWMLVGAVAVNASLFIAMVVYVIGALAAAYFGGKLAARIGGAVLTGEADERAIAAYDAVKAKLSALNPFGQRQLVPAKAR
jgi:hypothetical protein